MGDMGRRNWYHRVRLRRIIQHSLGCATLANLHEEHVQLQDLPLQQVHQKICPFSALGLPGKYVKGWRKWSERRQTWVAIFEFQARDLCVWYGMGDEVQ